MNILFLTIAWPNCGENNIYTDLMDEFVKHGHDVFVACSTEKRYKTQTSIEAENNIHVLRIKTGNLTKTAFIEKGIANFRLGGQFERAINKHFGNEKFDLILMSTPPITLSGVFEKLKAKYSAKTYLLLKDIWPQGIADLGLIKKNGLIYRYFVWQERRLYNAADVIGCLSPANIKFIQQHNSIKKTTVVEENPNVIKIRKPNACKNPEILKKYDLPTDKCIFIYGGNLGKPQGLEFFMKVLHLVDNKKAFFLIIGDGTEAGYVEDTVAKLKLPNVRYMRRLPKEDYERVCDSADVGLLLLDGRYTIPNFPSRLLSYCESRLPILSCTDLSTDVGDIIEEYNCGIKTEHGNVFAFIEAINRLTNDEELRKIMGSNAFKLLEKRYTSERSYEIIMQNFKGGK